MTANSDQTFFRAFTIVLGALFLITIVAIFASSIPWELVPSLPSDDARAEAMSLSGTSDCPDEEAPGQPCDDGCLCPCCPTLVTPPEVVGVPKLQPPVESQRARFVSVVRIDFDAGRNSAALTETSATSSSLESDGEMDHEQPGAQRRCPWQRLPGTGGYHSALRTPFAARTRNVALGLALVAGSSLAPAIRRRDV